MFVTTFRIMLLIKINSILLYVDGGNSTSIGNILNPLNLHSTLRETPDLPEDPKVLLNAKEDLEPLPDGIPLKDGASYDYIVVGAGAAGAPVAARLALAGGNVLLIEAGGYPNLLSWIPGTALALLGSDLDWQYPTKSNDMSCLSSRGHQCRFSRGKCLGGSTSTNYMMYVRGNRKDFDDIGLPGWSWDEMQPFFKKYEGFRNLSQLPPSSIPYHNTSGIMNIEFFGDSRNAWHSRILKGFRELGLPYNPDVNAKSQIGITQVIGFVYGGMRMSTARAYLSRPDVKKRLKIAIETLCTGVLIDNENVARGVNVVTGLLKRKINVYARKEVILSAGAIGTPQLLLLSGIGPAEHLTRMKIPVRADLPVGQNMRDHVSPLIFILVDNGFGLNAPNLAVYSMKVIDAAEWLWSHNGPLASNGLTDVTQFLNLSCYDFVNKRLINDSCNSQLPSAQFIYAYMDRNSIQGLELIVQHSINLNDEIFKQISDANVNNSLLIISPIVLSPESTGYVQLASTDPNAKPEIYPNFLTRIEDLEEMLRSIKFIEQLLHTETFKRYNARLMKPTLSGCPSSESDWKAYWECYCRHMTFANYHSAGTTALGSVVDARLRVRGVRRLRVADAGVMPRPVHGNPAASTIAIGERMAHFLIEEHLKKT